MAAMRTVSVLIAILLAVMTQRAESRPLELSLDCTTLPVAEAREPLQARSIELNLHALPGFLLREPGVPKEPLASYPSMKPEWFHLTMIHEALALHASPFGEPTALVPLADVIADVAPAPIAPLLEPVRLLTDLIVNQASEIFATRNVSVGVGDRLDENYAPLHNLAGDIQRGQYLRKDDVTGRQLNFDLRLVLAWRANDTIRLEAGYGIAYLSGEFGPAGPGSDHTSPYLIHGPCAAVNLDF
jgi:hypothetical protein